MMRADLDARKDAHTAWLERLETEENPTLEPVPDSWRLTIGDAVHNLRSCLDHLVCQLALSNGCSLGQCDKTLFPILTVDNVSAKKTFKERVEPFVCAKALDMIKFFQPYQGKDGTDFYPRIRRALWRLTKLDNIDKHRVLMVAEEWLRTDKIQIQIGDAPERWVFTANRPHWQRLKDYEEPSIEIAGLDKIVPQPEVKVHTDLTWDIALAETGGVCDDMGVVKLLGQHLFAVQRVIDEFDAEFFR